MKYKTVWDYMESISFTADDVISEVNDRNSAIELGWKLALKSIKQKIKSYENSKSLPHRGRNH